MGTTADKLARLSETKALLKTRLTEKGLDVASENNFYNLADKVGEISGGGISVKTGVVTPSSERGIIIPNSSNLTFITVSISNSDNFSTGIASATAYISNKGSYFSVVYQPVLSGNKPQCVTGEGARVAIDNDAILSFNFPFNEKFEYSYFAF